MTDIERKYYLGLGYLKGINVKRDPDRGVAMITDAAEAGLPEAMERLSNMYAFGDGVTPNRKTSKMWLDKYNETKTE